MAEHTHIEWTDATWNAWWGCQKVGPGCDNCYAEALDRRTGGAHWGAKADRRRTSERNWNAPLRWQRQADAFEAEHGRRRRVFCGSMMDIMDNAVPLEWSHEAFARIEECDRIDWQLLTKRVGNVADRIPKHWQAAWPRHVGLMITVVNQDEAHRDIPNLLDIKARYRIPWVGLSMEPLLGPVDIARWLNGSFECAEECGFRSSEFSPPPTERCHACGWEGESPGEFCPSCGHQDFGFVCPSCTANVVQHHPDTPNLDWVIVGGESGPGARPMHPDWARSLRDQCAAAGVAFHFKQWGEWLPFSQCRTPEQREAVSQTTIRSNKTGDGSQTYFGRALARHADGHLVTTTTPGIRPEQINRVGKKVAGRLLDGVTHDGFPEPLGDPR